MKWVCLLANMTVPGLGSLFAKRYWAGAIQTIGSVIGIALIIPLGIEVYQFFPEAYGAGLDKPETMSETFEGIIGEMKQPFYIAIGGLVIFHVTLIWAQVTTAQVFKAEKAAEAQESAEESVEVPPPLDSSN